MKTGEMKVGKCMDPCICTYMDICICVCTYVYVYVYAHIHIYVRKCTYSKIRNKIHKIQKKKNIKTSQQLKKCGEESE